MMVSLLSYIQELARSKNICFFTMLNKLDMHLVLSKGNMPMLGNKVVLRNKLHSVERTFHENNRFVITQKRGIIVLL